MEMTADCHCTAFLASTNLSESTIFSPIDLFVLLSIATVTRIEVGRSRRPPAAVPAFAAATSNAPSTVPIAPAASVGDGSVASVAPGGSTVSEVVSNYSTSKCASI